MEKNKARAKMVDPKLLMVDQEERESRSLQTLTSEMLQMTMNQMMRVSDQKMVMPAMIAMEMRMAKKKWKMPLTKGLIKMS